MCSVGLANFFFVIHRSWGGEVSTTPFFSVHKPTRFIIRSEQTRSVGQGPLISNVRYFFCFVHSLNSGKLFFFSTHRNLYEIIPLSFHDMYPPHAVGPWVRFSQTGRGAELRETARGGGNYSSSVFSIKRVGCTTCQTGQGSTSNGDQVSANRRGGERLGDGPTTWWRGAEVVNRGLFRPYHMSIDVPPLFIRWRAAPWCPRRPQRGGAGSTPKRYPWCLNVLHRFFFQMEMFSHLQ